jgi:malate dehydrogenase (oxaloacetate-decarboxylating)
MNPSATAHRIAPSDAEALRLHAQYRGKIQVAPKCPLRDSTSFSYWYTPGVAAPCLAIQADVSKVYEFTNKSNSIAVVSDGSRVLGLGNIGPRAALPVMEGKALLFKYLGGVDAIPICLATQDERQLVRTIQLLEPSFGGINLEDIAQPRCFRVLEKLRETMTIPVWHDDQQGSATAVLAAFINALKVTGKAAGSVKIAMVGMGAANVATYKLLKAYGVDPTQIVACDSRGTLHRHRGDLERLQMEFREKWMVCQETNPDGVKGGIQETLHGADVCIAFSRPVPGIIQTEWVRGMAKDAIMFACANPAPEIWPADAKRAGARIVATARGDFPNQLNNALVFPGIFRGTLDARASAIADQMALAAALELASYAQELGLREDAILPAMHDWEVVPRIAAATAVKAQELGLARVRHTRREYLEAATALILNSRRLSSFVTEQVEEARACGTEAAALHVNSAVPGNGTTLTGGR